MSKSLIGNAKLDWLSSVRVGSVKLDWLDSVRVKVGIVVVCAKTSYVINCELPHTCSALDNLDRGLTTAPRKRYVLLWGKPIAGNAARYLFNPDSSRRSSRLRGYQPAIDRTFVRGPCHSAGRIARRAVFNQFLLLFPASSAVGCVAL